MNSTPEPQTARYRCAEEADAAQWTGSNAAQLRAFCGSNFDTIDPEDRVEDPDETAAVRAHPHGGWLGLKPGDWVVKHADHFSVASDEEFRARWSPAALSAVPPVQERRDRYAAPLYALMRQNGWDGEYTEPVVREMDLVLDAVLAVADAEQAELRQDVHRLGLTVDEYGQGASALTDKLRRARTMHRETCPLATGALQAGFACSMCELLDAPAAPVVPPAPTSQTALLESDEEPLSPYYEHPACGFHWHGRDGMDIPVQDDGQPVCPRCELAKVQKQLDYTQRRRDEVGAECKRRGRIKLEQAETIVRLERQLDEVRTQLGAEILRAGQAETELRRLAAVPAAEEQPAVDRLLPDGTLDYDAPPPPAAHPDTPLHTGTSLDLAAEEQPDNETPEEPRQSCGCGQDGCEYCDVDEPEPLPCPRCGNDMGDYGEDDFVYRTGDVRPYCSGECVVAAHRAALKAAPPAVVSQPDEEAENPRTVCVCGHTRGEHLRVSGRLLCDACAPDSTENLVCKEFEAL